MALVFCRECGKQISDSASSCPHCGAPQQENKSVLEQASHKVDNSSTQTQKDVNKKSNNKLILWGALIILALIGGYTVINNMNHETDKSNPPKPIVSSQRTKDDNASSVIKWIIDVEATIQNEGGMGNVIVTAKVYQGEGVTEKTKTIYFQAGQQSQDVSIAFSEVTRLGGEVKAEVSAVPE